MSAPTFDPIAVAKTLEQAADVIDERGWFQGALSDWPARGGRLPRVCVVGAIQVARYGSPEPVRDDHRSDPEFVALSQHVWQRAPQTCAPVSKVTAWNDRKRRRRGEVTQALRDCGMRLRDGWIPDGVA